MASTVANIFHNSLAKFLTMLVGVIASTILARNLGANDYGVVGIASIVISFLSRFSDMGMSSALVQRKVADKPALETAQALNVILVVSLFCLAVATAPLTAVLFKNPVVPKVVGILACTLLINAVGFLPSTLLTREMRFATLRMPAVAGAIVRGMVAVFCALSGWKYWSLVAGMLAGGITTAVLLRVVRPARAHWRIDAAIARELLHFGLPLFFAGLLVFLVFNVDNFVIGSFLGATQLGYYTVAITWSTYVCSTLNETVHSVLFPRFSQIQHSRDELAAMYSRSLRAVMFTSVLVNAILFAVAEGFLVTVLGKGSTRWLPALAPLQILCIYGAVRASMETLGSVITALGRPKLMLSAALIPAALELCFLPFIARKWGLSAVAWLVCGAYAIQWVVYAPFLRKELSVRTSDLLRVSAPIVLSATVAVLTARTIRFGDPTSLRCLIARAAVVCASFAVVHEAVTRGSMWSEVKRVLSSRGRRPQLLAKAVALWPWGTKPERP